MEFVENHLSTLNGLSMPFDITYMALMAYLLFLLLNRAHNYFGKLDV